MNKEVAAWKQGNVYTCTFLRGTDGGFHDHWTLKQEKGARAVPAFRLLARSLKSPFVPFAVSHT